MARKVFQDFAHVLCQRFIALPSNMDLVNLVLLGGGRLEMDVMGRRATFERCPLAPFPYSEEARGWILAQMAKRAIPPEQLAGAWLVVDYSVEFTPQRRHHCARATFDLVCTGRLAAPDRRYSRVLAARKDWGLLPFAAESPRLDRGVAAPGPHGETW